MVWLIKIAKCINFLNNSNNTTNIISSSINKLMNYRDIKLNYVKITELKGNVHMEINAVLLMVKVNKN